MQRVSSSDGQNSSFWFATGTWSRRRHRKREVFVQQVTSITIIQLLYDEREGDINGRKVDVVGQKSVFERGSHVKFAHTQEPTVRKTANTPNL